MLARNVRWFQPRETCKVQAPPPRTLVPSSLSFRVSETQRISGVFWENEEMEDEIWMKWKLIEWSWERKKLRVFTMANADSHDKGLEAIPPSLFAGFGGAALPGKGQSYKQLQNMKANL